MLDAIYDKVLSWLIAATEWRPREQARMWLYARRTKLRGDPVADEQHFAECDGSAGCCLQLVGERLDARRESGEVQLALAKHRAGWDRSHHRGLCPLPVGGRRRPRRGLRPRAAVRAPSGRSRHQPPGSGPGRVKRSATVRGGSSPHQDHPAFSRRDAGGAPSSPV